MNVSELLDVVDREDLYPNRRDLRSYLNFTFKNVSFGNRVVLDVGGGIGIFSFYAACMGVREVVCLEPAAADPTSNVATRFSRLQAALPNVDRITLVASRIQDFDPQAKTFDIILLLNSINHLDEEACTRLLHDAEAPGRYRRIFQKLSDMAAAGAKLIATDWSRHNLFALLGLKNPFAPTIRWDLHQSPARWARLLTDAGFHNPRVRWTPLDGASPVVRALTVNKVASFFLASHFCLTMDKP